MVPTALPQATRDQLLLSGMKILSTALNAKTTRRLITTMAQSYMDNVGKELAAMRGFFFVAFVNFSVLYSINQSL